MLEIEIISVNKPDYKKAAEFLGKMLYEKLEKERYGDKAPSLRGQTQKPDEPDSGDSVA